MLINASALLVLAERKIMGFMQQRYGPYLVGPHGLLQPLADILKLLFKEELRPKDADKWLFTLAPMISVTAAFAAFAAVPWGAETTFFGLLDTPVKLGVADVNVARARRLRDHVDGRLRHRARRVVIEQQVLAARRTAIVGADDQLRAGVRDRARVGHHARRLALAARGRRRAGGLLVGLHPALVPVPAAGRLHHLRHRRRRRDQPRAVRFSRGGAGARGRLQHRVQLGALRAVSAGRVHQHDDDVGGGDRPVPGRMARAVPRAVRIRVGSGSSRRWASSSSPTSGCAGPCRGIATTS